MAEVRAQWTEALTKDLYKYMFEKYDQLPKVYPSIFQVEQMDSAYVKETAAIGMGQLSERKEGADIIASNALEGFTVIGKARTWSDAFELTMEVQEDTPPEKIANMARDIASTWAEGVVNSQETFAANFFNYGGYTAGHDIFNNTITGVIDDGSADLIYDGKPFFNLSNNLRSSKGGGTYYNGTANVLSITNLQTAYNLQTNTNNRNERDEKVALMPNVLVHPPALRFTVKSVLENEWVGGNANLDINTTRNLVQPIEWHYLSDSDAWFLGVRQKGIKFLERRIPIIEYYRDPKSKKLFVTIDARWGAVVNNWRYWVGNAFSTS